MAKKLDIKIIDWKMYKEVEFSEVTKEEIVEAYQKQKTTSAKIWDISQKEPIWKLPTIDKEEDWNDSYAIWDYSDRIKPKKWEDYRNEAKKIKDNIRHTSWF